MGLPAGEPVQDRPALAALKDLVRASGTLDLKLQRRWRRVRGERPYQLAGDCESCARCCEEPSIQVGRLTWFLPTLRWLFLAWQRRVNGFELLRRERPRVFVFECSHFDHSTRRCDSYSSRPLMCRDYPRLQLWQATPQLFEGCGYRAVAPNAAALKRALEQALGPEGARQAGEGLNLE